MIKRRYGLLILISVMCKLEIFGNKGILNDWRGCLRKKFVSEGLIGVLKCLLLFLVINMKSKICYLIRLYL